MDDNEYQRRYAADEANGPRERAPETEEQRAHRERWEEAERRERLAREADARLKTITEAEDKRMALALWKLPGIVKTREPGMVRKTYLLREVANELAAVIGPKAVCAKGCSHCCKQHVSLSEPEAIAIGRRIGRAPSAVKECKTDYDINVATRRKQQEYIGTPCTFLADDGTCAIYEERPLACRTHMTLADSPEWCDTHRGLKVRDVPYFHNEGLQVAMYRTFYGTNRADIREFFPPIPKEG